MHIQGRTIAGLAVHLYTALGAPLAFVIVLAAIRGDVRLALGLEFVTMFIDGSDGWLARAVRVKEVVPWIDGRLLDNIVDYLTYVFAPIVLLWQAGYLPSGAGGIILAVLPLLASCYQFCRTDAKTADHFFLGFPSYWNIVAFYAIVLHLGPVVVGTIVALCALLVFVPVRYLYPSRTAAFFRLTLALTCLWLLLYLVIVAQLPQPQPWLIIVSLLYPVYYLGLSGYLTGQALMGRRNV